MSKYSDFSSTYRKYGEDFNDLDAASHLMQCHSKIISLLNESLVAVDELDMSRFDAAVSQAGIMLDTLRGGLDIKSPTKHSKLLYLFYSDIFAAISDAYDTKEYRKHVKIAIDKLNDINRTFLSSEQPIP